MPAFLIFRKSKWIDRKIRAAKNRPTSTTALGTSYASHRGAVSSLLARILGPGYGTPQTNTEPATLHSGHRFAFLLTAGFFVCYICTGRSAFHELLQPGPWSHQLSPVLFYLLLLIMFWCPLLCGLTFFFDRFRIPALAMLGVALYVLALPNASDHQFDTVANRIPGYMIRKQYFLETARRLSWCPQRAGAFNPPRGLAAYCAACDNKFHSSRRMSRPSAEFLVGRSAQCST